MSATRTDRENYRSSATPSLLSNFSLTCLTSLLIVRGQIAEATCPRVLLFYLVLWIT
jgi:hypothetical protein